jgi:hypothetical protein
MTDYKKIFVEKYINNIDEVNLLILYNISYIETITKNI